MRKLAEINVARAHEAHDRLVKEADVAPRFSGPFFNEFVVSVKGLERLFRECAKRKIVPGISLAQWYPELEDCLLLCATEMNEKEGIDALVGTFSGK